MSRGGTTLLPGKKNIFYNKILFLHFWQFWFVKLLIPAKNKFIVKSKICIKLINSNIPSGEPSLALIYRILTKIYGINSVNT